LKYTVECCAVSDRHLAAGTVVQAAGAGIRALGADAVAVVSEIHTAAVQAGGLLLQQTATGRHAAGADGLAADATAVGAVPFKDAGRGVAGLQGAITARTGGETAGTETVVVVTTRVETTERTICSATILLGEICTADTVIFAARTETGLLVTGGVQTLERTLSGRAFVERANETPSIGVVSFRRTAGTLTGGGLAAYTAVCVGTAHFGADGPIETIFAGTIRKAAGAYPADWTGYRAIGARTIIKTKLRQTCAGTLNAAFSEDAAPPLRWVEAQLLEAL